MSLSQFETPVPVSNAPVKNPKQKPGVCLQSWTTLHAKIERLLNLGRFEPAFEMLKTVNSARVPRSLLVPFARQARRLEHPEFGFRLLAPLVRPADPRAAPKPTPRECVEYAGLLQAIGSLDEALQLLRAQDPEKVPEAVLYQAYCHMNRWNSQEAADCLKTYLQFEVEPDLRLNAKINLASSLMGIPNYSVALEAVRECIDEAERSEHTRLLGHCHLIEANIHLAQRETRRARRSLALAEPILGVGVAHDRRMLAQRFACLEAFETGRPETLLQYRPQALASGDWIALRETDFEILMVEFDQRRFNFLYFGTPFPAYRARIRRELGVEPHTDTYVYGALGSPCLDLRTGKIDNGPELNSGKKVHQILNVLLRDFYAPARLGTMFAELFPGDYFDVATSPGRVHQVLSRARQFLKENSLPIQLRERGGYYSLEIVHPFSFRVSLERTTRGTNELSMERLSQAFGEAQFRAAEGRALLTLSASGFKKLMAWALENGAVERTGANRQTRYRLTSPVLRKTA
jgi:hypothetical protein